MNRRSIRQPTRRGRGLGLVGALVVIWLVIGVVAAIQRDYFSGSDITCAKSGTVAATVVAGPLNYLGVNPKVKCDLPEPSK